MITQTATTPGPAQASMEQEPLEFPVREYIGAMAVELAQMARWDGDEDLGRLLDEAAARAGESARPMVVAQDQPARRRSA
jgi:hypothetical protein